MLSDDTYRTKIFEIQSFLLSYSWVKSGEDFFIALAEYLADLLDADYICIDRLHSTLEAETVAVWFDGHFDDNYRYTLTDTPCGNVLANEVCTIPEKVRYLFPRDEFLQHMGAESYAGITLRNSDGKAIGLIAVISRKRSADMSVVQHLLRQVAISASAELQHRDALAERDQMLYDLHMANELLEVTVSERTAILTDTNRQLREEIETRKRNEKLLKEAELKYRTVADFTYDGESWLGTNGSFIYVSPSFERLTGYPADDFLTNSSLYYEVAHPDDREMIQKHFEHILFPNDEICNLQFRIITKSGEIKWIHHTCQPAYNAEGDWIGQRGTNRDITFEKHAEKILLTSQKQLRALTNRLDEVAEQERKNVARHIHDELGHLLTALKFDLDNIALEKEKTIGDMVEDFKSVNELISSLINSVRKLSTELRPEIIDQLGLLPALEWQVREFRKRTKLCCNLKMEEMNHPFSSRETTVIFRILQEILTNIARHADAEHVNIFIVEKQNRLVMHVIDDGKGFDTSNYSAIHSLGLLGMHERALSIDGEVIIESSSGKGTKVTFSLPLKKTIPTQTQLN